MHAGILDVLVSSVAIAQPIAPVMDQIGHDADHEVLGRVLPVAALEDRRLAQVVLDELSGALASFSAVFGAAGLDTLNGYVVSLNSMSRASAGARPFSRFFVSGRLMVPGSRIILSALWQ